MQVLVVAVRIFFKRRTHEAGRGSLAFGEGWGEVFHQHLNQLCRTVARHDILFADAKALAGNQRVHLHARRVFRQQRVEIGPQLVLQAATGEIGIHQIAEIQHLRESPKTAIASVVFAQHVLLVGKQGLGNVQILLVVNLVPLLLSYGQGLHVVIVQQRDDA